MIRHYAEPEGRVICDHRHNAAYRACAGTKQAAYLLTGLLVGYGRYGAGSAAATCASTGTVQ
jgi:hypothetical protein